MTRITTSALSFNAERNLAAAAARLATIQDKIGSNKQISRPSDDPAGAAEAMAVRTEQRQNAQFSRNAADANGWLSSTDVALSAATSLLHRVRDLTAQGANDGALGPEAREAIALELDQLREQMVGVANTQYRGRFLFAGTSDAGSALDANLQFSQGSEVLRRIGPNSSVRVDADGAAAFGQGQDSVFSLISAIAQDLRNGVNVSSRLETVDAHLQNILATQASVGASHATVRTAEQSLLGDAVNLEARRAGTEDIDLATAILELKSQEVAYQAALSAAARTLQPSLMDFLR